MADEGRLQIVSVPPLQKEEPAEPEPVAVAPDPDDKPMPEPEPEPEPVAEVMAIEPTETPQEVDRQIEWSDSRDLGTNFLGNRSRQMTTEVDGEKFTLSGRQGKNWGDNWTWRLEPEGESRAWWTGQGTPDEALQKANERLIETLARRDEQPVAETSAVPETQDDGIAKQREYNRKRTDELRERREAAEREHMQGEKVAAEKQEAKPDRPPRVRKPRKRKDEVGEKREAVEREQTPVESPAVERVPLGELNKAVFFLHGANRDLTRELEKMGRDVSDDTLVSMADAKDAAENMSSSTRLADFQLREAFREARIAKTTEPIEAAVAAPPRPAVAPEERDDKPKRL